MMRSLFSGVAGLKTHQTKMDVIGNNIANVNTVAYKSQSVTFQDLMYQTTQSASGANADTGRAGINAKQIGLGVKNGAISTAITTSGSTQNTGNPFDIQINSDAFFIVSDGQNNFFTRAGTFNIDGNGTLCMTTNGYTVQGWLTDKTTGEVLKNTVQPLTVMSAENMTSEAEATSEAFMTGIIDSNDDQLVSEAGQVSTIQFYDDKGYSYTLKFAIHSAAVPNVDGAFEMKATTLLDSKGDVLADGSTDPKIDDFFTGGVPTIKLQYNPANGELVSCDPDAGGGLSDCFNLNFNTTGPIAAAGFSPTIVVDMGTTKNINNKGVSTIAGRTGNVENTALNAGHSAGTMQSLSIQTDGKILATYTNGTSKILGQIAVATFANAAGLQKEGENLYSATANSGDFDGIGVDISADGGSMSSGVLEMSNVDLSSEFTEMITTQRGFQANSRIITVSDTLLEELVNLKR